MAVFSRSSSSSTWIISLKVMLISTGILFIALILKISVPAMLDFAVSGIPVLWSSVRSWLTPPYLYFVINGIIITIVASARFHHASENHSETVAPAKVTLLDLQSEEFNPVEIPVEFSFGPGLVNNPVTDVLSDLVVLESPAVSEHTETVVSEAKTVTEDAKSYGESDEFVISRSDWTPIPPPQRTDSIEFPTEYSIYTEKPLVSSRFGHRKPIRSSPEGGKALRVAKPKRQETLESTWKTITDGRSIPLTRHLRKSDTWENHGRQINTTLETSPMPRKSETFKDRTNNPPSPASLYSSPASGKLKKEASLSQDDLNRRVEAFIKKFNEDMRLQRQESLNRYKEMITRGSAR